MNQYEIEQFWDNITQDQMDKFIAGFLKLIDAELSRVGYSHIEEITDEHGFRHIQKGSSPGKVGVVVSDNAPLYIVEADVMDLPSDRDLILPLMRELLEMNHYISGEQRFGIDGEKVTMKAVVSCRYLKSGDIARILHTVMSMADDLDDKLQEKYLGTTISRAETDEENFCVFVDINEPSESVSITGFVDGKTRDLILECKESGELVEETYDTDEHQYRIVIPEEQKPALLKELEKMLPDQYPDEPYSDESLCDAIGALFAEDKEFIKKVIVVCKNAGIRYHESSLL